MLFFLLATAAFTGCRSYVKVDVAVFNGAIDEYRQAQEALALIPRYEEARRSILAQGQALGLVDGTISNKLARAIVEGNAAVEAKGNVDVFKESLASEGNKTLRNALQRDISMEIGAWPSPREMAELEQQLEQLQNLALGMNEAATRLARRPVGAVIPSVMESQARFTERQTEFKRIEKSARAKIDQALSVLTKLSNVMTNMLKPETIRFLAERGSNYLPLQAHLDGAENILRAVQEIPQQVAEVQRAKELGRRLIEFDANVDLSDPNWRYVANAPEINWSTVQYLKAEADGDANYVIIQQSMGDFRLKKLFNDPTEGYKAGVRIGQKVFETVATAAIAASTGGAGLPFLPRSPGAQPAPPASETGETPAAPEPPPSVAVQIAQEEARLAQLAKERAFAQAEIRRLRDMLRDLQATNLSANVLLSTSNTLDVVRSVLAPNN